MAHFDLDPKSTLKWSLADISLLQHLDQAGEGQLCRVHGEEHVKCACQALGLNFPMGTVEMEHLQNEYESWPQLELLICDMDWNEERARSCNKGLTIQELFSVSNEPSPFFKNENLN